jgi:hypothetical protein
VKHTALLIWFLVLSFLTGLPAFSQTGFYIPPKGKVHFAGDTSTIFSNVSNNGHLGVGKNAVVNFKGQTWANDPASQITDETDTTTGIGGWIRFMGDSIRQQVYGGYNAASKTGPAFPHVQVANKNGIELVNSSIKVKREVSLSNGLVYLNDKIFAVGNNNPGLISGYNASRYFVTGTAANGGILLRENIRAGDSLIVFPVGTKANAYTPAAIQSKSSQGDDYYVSVFDGVRSRLFNGNDLKDSSVNKTWQIGKLLHPGEGEADVFLQHQNIDEGAAFSQNKRFSYVSEYSGSSWDYGTPLGTPGIGNLTTGPSLLLSGVNKRTFTLSNASYFTKFANRDTSIKTKLVFGGYRVNSNIVKLNWQTNPEVNVKYFVVQRRKANEPGFSNIDTISSKAFNGFSLATLLYSLNDSNNYKGITFYRLEVFDYNNSGFYSNVIAINGAGFNVINLWPNPTPDEFYMIVNAPSARQIVIFNVLGQKVWSQPINVNAQTYIHVKGHGLITGNYYVSIIDGGGQVLHTEKLVIVRN